MYLIPISTAGSPYSILAMNSSFPNGTTWITTPPGGRNTWGVYRHEHVERVHPPRLLSPFSSTASASNPAAAAARMISSSFTSFR
ncbi:hypothetical protein PR202_ga23679 [Eleusine coracana subsp. coracana]|uniref:Uncharacterized protein n=1 Tax=Eleusine coracana subsp. coracana TaxID=191504 RepID=A0AAV5D6I3_ELECO|nr:hypothetical protein PR202_ga23679 [Eleusine coracana subsp. coracana]